MRPGGLPEPTFLTILALGLIGTVAYEEVTWLVY